MEFNQSGVAPPHFEMIDLMLLYRTRVSRDEKPPGKSFVENGRTPIGGGAADRKPCFTAESTSSHFAADLTTHARNGILTAAPCGGDGPPGATPSRNGPTTLPGQRLLVTCIAPTSGVDATTKFSW